MRLNKFFLCLFLPLLLCRSGISAELVKSKLPGVTYLLEQTKPQNKFAPAVVNVASSQLLGNNSKTSFTVFDALTWQSTSLNVPGSIFGPNAELRELNNQNEDSSRPDAFYASPFNPEVKKILVKQVDEIARKFPEASGLVLDLHLSDRDILGYSETARAEAIKELGLDPIDLGLSNRANTILDGPVREWVNWRKAKMLDLVKTLAATYRKAHPGGKVMIMGEADYYSQTEFNDLRTGQDWKAWAQSGAVDGVFLRGRWLSRFGDTDRFEYYNRLWPDWMKSAGHPVMLVPFSSGSRLMPQTNYERDWRALKGAVLRLVQFGLIVEDEADQKQAAKFLKGEPLPIAVEKPLLGELAPAFSFSDGAGKTWDSTAWAGKNGAALLALPTAAKSGPFIKALEEATPKLREIGFEPLVATSNPLDDAPQIPNLLDRGRELLDLYPASPTLLVIDKAGFLRAAAPLAKPADLVAALPAGAMKTVQEGQNAPDFALRDMNGQMRRLTELKGKKNLLLTFFPKCFTGRCANHLTSIRDAKSDFDKADTEIWAVSIDPADVQQAFAGSLNLTFPLLPDTGRNLCLLYGATTNTTDLAARMSVFIDKNGVVKWIDKNVNVATHGADVLAKMRECKLMP